MLACAASFALGSNGVGAKAAKTGKSGRPAVRVATTEDARQAAMLVTAMGYPTNASDMCQRLEALTADPSYATFVAEVDGEVVGLAGVCIARFYERNGQYARLVALVVSESSSGQGVGATLVREAEKWATAQGAVEIFLNSGTQREGSRMFYTKLGYRESGIRFSKELS